MYLKSRLLFMKSPSFYSKHLLLSVNESIYLQTRSTMDPKINSSPDPGTPPPPYDYLPPTSMFTAAPTTEKQLPFVIDMPVDNTQPPSHSKHDIDVDQCNLRFFYPQSSDHSQDGTNIDHYNLEFSYPRNLIQLLYLVCFAAVLFLLFYAFQLTAAKPRV